MGAIILKGYILDIKDCEPRLKVKLAEYCSHTRDTQGWDRGMDKFQGKACTIEKVTLERKQVILKECNEYFWDHRDLEEVQVINVIQLKGKTQIFDINELV